MQAGHLLLGDHRYLWIAATPEELQMCFNLKEFFICPLNNPIAIALRST